jgi:Glycosyltransferases involved in cell wall biogenesis
MKISAVILTKDEEKHIVRCIESIRDACSEIIVIDSGSADRTCEIASSMGATVLANPWKNYATQFNFGLSRVADDADWVLRIDADEFLSPGWSAELERIDRIGPRVAGVMVDRYLSFRGRVMRFGGSVTKQLRLFRNKRGVCENRWMDEHISVDGDIADIPVMLVDLNLNDMRWWSDKHMKYADREMIDSLLRANGQDTKPDTLHLAPRIKRFLKDRVYLHMPTTVRAVLYFVYRYVFLLGFLDGRIGFQFTFFQGLWYRMYVDARIEEVYELARREGCTLEEAARRMTGINF